MHCESEVSCLRTQHNVPSQGSNLDRSIGDKRTNHEGTTPPRACDKQYNGKHYDDNKRQIVEPTGKRSLENRQISTEPTNPA